MKEKCSDDTASRKDEEILALFEKIIPFRFLSLQERRALAGDLEVHIFRKGDTIFRQGDTEDKRVYLLQEGSVETVDLESSPIYRLNVISDGHYFGERAALFDQPRFAEVRALEDSKCYSMSGGRFLRLIRESRAFAQAIGTILRDKQGIFAAFDHFTAELRRGIATGHLDIQHLLTLYQDLEPALHPHAMNPTHIDFSGLVYAVRRLPENVTRTFAYLLTDEIPMVFEHPDKLFREVLTEARRRNIWEMLPGKSMVLLRNGLSDLLDFITCLCLYAVEARKIRYRLDEPNMLLRLHRHLSEPAPVGKSPPPVRDILRTLPFTEEEVAGLSAVWPETAAERIHDIARHREIISIDIRRQTNSYNSRRSELWTVQLGNATRQLIGHEPNDLPRDVKVHVICSNSHSVANCLSPSLISRKDEIFAWAKNRPIAQVEWFNEYDALYAYARDYFTAHPEEFDRMREQDTEWGVLRLQETASTGIQVQLFDTKKLAGHRIDPGITPVREGRNDLIVNIDYAFGEQAKEIMRNLLMLFGRNLVSINILGKAGALQGQRSDILVPTAFVEQASDLFQPLPEQSWCCDRLKSRVPNHAIHYGPMLTVAGTLLQNRMMLHFYKHIWGCIGLEMEGTSYYSQILESSQLGVIPRDVALRFFYYISDLPLDRKGSLSVRMRAQEGIPPLYAITREVLSEILE